MKKILFLIPIVVLAACSGPAEKKSAPFREATSELYDSTLRPFHHGVASGDPLTDRVIIWTRVTPDDSVSSINVKWQMSESSDFASIIKEDTLSTSPARDYTVKVDVDGLQEGHTYYYRFAALGKTSMTGKTRTAPSGARESLKFAVVSCANWEWGYFNAYEAIAAREDVDAVLHLGDYIYEYGPGKYGDTTIRRNYPPHEIVTMSDYRTRYSSYHTDKGLRLMRQNIPLIAVWDDHEIANDSYTEGAQNHQADTEGDYMSRKAIAKQVYYEWLPVREGEKLYRSFSYGSLADVIMLDERLEGKTKQADSVTAPDFNNQDRHILGADQLGWLESKMKESKATWKVLGNQVMLSDVYLSKVSPKRPRNLDSWDGYPAEKKSLIDFIQSNKIGDVVVVTGDTHASWAIEAATDVKKSYNPKTSKGAFAVEFGTTSVSSANEDERNPVDEVKKMEKTLLSDNPHIKFVNERDHGYLLLSLFPDKTVGEWYFVNTLKKQDSGEFLGAKYTFGKGSVQLVESKVQ